MYVQIGSVFAEQQIVSFSTDPGQSQSKAVSRTLLVNHFQLVRFSSEFRYWNSDCHFHVGQGDVQSRSFSVGPGSV